MVRILSTLFIGAVHILSARCLQSAAGPVHVNPYCICEIPGRAASKIKTKVVENSSDPVWDEEFEISDYDPGDDLVFTVYHDNAQPMPDDFLGRVEVRSAQVSCPGGLDAELQLKLPPGTQRQTMGAACLRVRVAQIASGAAPSTPLRHAGGYSTMARARSAPRGAGPYAAAPLGAGLALRAAQESALLTVVRRQMETLEEKLCKQLQRAQQQHERLQEAALSRLDVKVGAVEVLQPRIEKKLAELGGNCKALSDEMMLRFQEFDEQESKFREWRRQFQEETRAQFAAVESESQRSASAVRSLASSTEANFKRDDERLARLEGLLEDRQLQHEDASQGMLTMHSRITDLEERARAELEPQRDLDAPMLLNMEGKLGDLRTKLGSILQETHDAHERMEAQEQRLNLLHAQHSSKEDQHRRLSDRVERVPHLEGRFKELEARVQEVNQHKLDHQERLEMLTTRLAGSEQAHDEARQILSQLDPSISNQESAARLEALETQLDALRGEVDLNAHGTDQVLAPRLEALVQQLREIAPRLRDQELHINDVIDRVKQIEKAMGWHVQRGVQSQQLELGGRPGTGSPTSLKREAIFVTHGSFNPVHRGHLQMVFAARRRLELEGYTVTKAVLGIASADHMWGKGAPILEDSCRVACINILAAELGETWIGGDSRGVDFHSGKQMAAMLAEERSDIVVFNVKGADLAERYGVHYNFPTVFVGRKGFEMPQEGEGPTYTMAIDAETGSFNSNEARQAIKEQNFEPLQRLCGWKAAEYLLQLPNGSWQ